MKMPPCEGCGAEWFPGPNGRGMKMLHDGDCSQIREWIQELQAKAAAPGAFAAKEVKW